MCLGSEHLVDSLDAPGEKPLLPGVLRSRLENMPILFEAIGPVVVSHHAPRRFHLLGEPGKRGVRRRRRGVTSQPA